MPRILTALFRRDPTRDREDNRIRYLGLRAHWPDGREVTVGLQAFCQHGQRLLGLHRLLADRPECMLRMVVFPVADEEQRIHRVPGFRVRRFFLQREGAIGRIHFMDGTPTEIVFHLLEDEPKVLNWIGLTHLEDGDRQWFDFTAVPVENGEGRVKIPEFLTSDRAEPALR